jgi:Fanconi anemia group J protein
LAINKKIMESESNTVPKIGCKKSAARGGILVFFSSYKIMETIVERWKESDIFDRLKAGIGHVILEPRGGPGKSSINITKNAENEQYTSGNEVSMFEPNVTTKTNFMLSGTTPKKKKQLKDPDDPEDEEFNGIIEEFDNAINKIGSCLLLAVCRGKVSEGIDFSDNKGRVVIVPSKCCYQ